MRIVHVVNVRWWNASAAYAVAAARATHSRGHDTVLIADHGSPVAAHAREARLTVEEIPTVDRVDRATALPGLRALARAFAAIQPECLVAHRPESHTWCALLRRGRTALIAARTDARPPRRTLAARALFARVTDAVIVPAHYARAEHIVPLGVEPARVHVVPFPVDTAHYAPGDRAAARGMYGWSPEERIACIVARLSRVKGHAVLVDAFARVLLDLPSARLVISGEEDDVTRASLVAHARAAGVDGRVTVLDRVADPRVLFAAADVGVVASIGSEAICRVAEEWMASARPIVGTAVNAVAETIEDGVTGVRVPPNDAGALARALRRLLADETLCMRMGRAARERATRVFGEDAFADAFARVCASAVRRRAGGT